MKTRIAALALAGAMLTTMLPMASASYQGTVSMTIGSSNMLVNGFSMPIDAEGSRASIYNGSTVLPIRGLLESMGGSLVWNETNRTVTMKYGTETVVVTLGSKTAVVNGKNVTMPVAPFTDNGRTYVWVRTVEYFDGVSVSWNDTTRTASVSYASSTAIGTPLTLSVHNGTYNQIRALALAPADTANYSANIMGADYELLGGERGNYPISIQPGKYDLRATDAYGNNFIYQDIDLTTAQSAAFVTLTSGASYSLSIDGMPAVSDRTVNLVMLNNTGKNIQNIRYAPTGNWIWQEAPASYIGNGSNGVVAIPFSSAQPYYDLLVTYTNGSTQAFQGVNMAYQSNSVMITLRENDYVYGRDYHEVEVTFENKLGEDIEELYIYTGSFSNADDLLSRDLKSGDSKSFDLDLGGETKWYIRAYTDASDNEYISGSVTIDKSSEEVKLRLNSSEKYEVRYQDYGGWADYDDEYEITVANFSGTKIQKMFFVDLDDMEDMEDGKWTYEDLDDEYDNVKTLSHAAVKTYDVDNLDSRDEVGLVVIYDTDFDEDDDMDDIDAAFFELDFDDIQNAGVVVITEKDEAEVYVDDDYDSDEYGVLVYNNTTSSVSKSALYITEEDEGDKDYILSGSLSADDYELTIFDLDDKDYDDYVGGVEIYVSGDYDSAKSYDLDSSDYMFTFVIVNDTDDTSDLTIYN